MVGSCQFQPFLRGGVIEPRSFGTTGFDNPASQKTFGLIFNAGVYNIRFYS